MTAFTWVLTAASLVGTVMNIKIDRRCFYIWAVTNACWMVIDFQAGQYAQSALFGVYFLLSLQGVRQWQRKQAGL